MAPAVDRCVAAIQRDGPLAPNLPRIVMQRLSQTEDQLLAAAVSAGGFRGENLSLTGRALHKSRNRRYRQSAATNFLR